MDMLSLEGSLEDKFLRINGVEEDLSCYKKIINGVRLIVAKNEDEKNLLSICYLHCLAKQCKDDVSSVLCLLEELKECLGGEKVNLLSEMLCSLKEKSAEINKAVEEVRLALDGVKTSMVKAKTQIEFSLFSKKKKDLEINLIQKGKILDSMNMDIKITKKKIAENLDMENRFSDKKAVINGLVVEYTKIYEDANPYCLYDDRFVEKVAEYIKTNFSTDVNLLGEWLGYGNKATVVTFYSKKDSIERGNYYARPEIETYIPSCVARCMGCLFWKEETEGEDVVLKKYSELLPLLSLTKEEDENGFYYTCLGVEVDSM